MLYSRSVFFLSALPNSVRLAWRNLRVNTDPGSLIIILGLPAMYLVFMGNMYVSIIPSFIIGGYHYTYRSFLPGGILAFESVMAGTMGGSMLWADRRFGVTVYRFEVDRPKTIWPGLIIEHSVSF